MKTLKEEVKFRCSADELWTILSDVGRCDWVPTIETVSDTHLTLPTNREV